LPLRRSEDPDSVRVPVAGDSAVSHEVGCTLECCEHWSIRCIGLPVPTSSRNFQRLCGFPSVPSPVPLRVRVHPLMRFTSPTEYVAACHLPFARKLWAPSLGSLSPSRHKCVESTIRQVSHTRLRFAHSVSHALDDLLLLTPRGPISSHCHVRDSLFRGFLCCQAGSSHRPVVPSCRYRVSASQRVAPPLPAPLAPPSGR